MKKETFSIYFESKSQLCSTHKKAHVILGQMYKKNLPWPDLDYRNTFLENKGWNCNPILISN